LSTAPARAACRVTTLLLLGLSTCLWASGCTNINTRLAMNKGINQFKSKEYEHAVESFKAASVVDPNYADAYLDLGLTYMELYEPGSEHPKDKEYAEGAIQAFKKYIQLTPGNEKGQEYLINICNLSKRMDDAVEFFKADYEKNPKDLNMVKKLGALYRMAGNMDKAIEFAEKDAELEPDSAEAWYTIGAYYWGRSYNSMNLDYDARMQIIDKGLAALERAMALKKDYTEAISFASLLYREKVKYDISPAQSVIWRQKADEMLAKAMELRNKAMAEAAAAADKASGNQPAAPAKTGGE
jgi:tetratricopeptide (TPR) repeat protein